ncbi:D-mannonate oxidoreductase [Paramesorhizobium deserti]|uniref:D-mannonate oxidoreductase n=1 Tax=Paramesorhizobium deserti TaxID=1494590 RepID=A0A135HY87_9HYPH|nr:D-mannonate oxidoreductase [Paramesorhizobium deserti]KXF78118.1 D-mannonate oxidoreductase [Paramesorhizobium deserti]
MSTTPILQFGTSRFLQAHADLFVSDSLARGEALGPITVVQSSGEATRGRRLQALTAPEGFPVRIEGIEAGRPVQRIERVTSIRHGLSTATDWPEIVRIAAQEAEIILSNTSDAGWVPQREDDEPRFHQAMSYPAKLTQLLLARFRAEGRRLTIMPTELVARNGDKLRERVFELARPLAPGLADWIAESVIFANSLVDRIVSEPLEPAGAVAEPYALWAVEEQPGLVLPCQHAALTQVSDLNRIERMKLHILNLGHSYLVAGWLAEGGAGSPLVREKLADPAVRADLESLYAHEVLPVFAAAGYGDAADYVATTLDRFANPFLAHRLSDIAQNHAEKLHRRIGAFLHWGAALGVTVPQPRLLRVLATAEQAP